MWYYLKISVFLAQLIRLSVCCEKQKDVLGTILRKFFGTTPDICYILDDVPLEEGLWINENNRYVVKMGHLLTVGEIPQCFSTIISSPSSNGTTLYKLIEKYINLTESRVLLILEKSMRMETIDLFNITWERNLNIVILKGIPNAIDFMGAQVSENIEERYHENITLYSIMWNEQLLSCSLDDFSCFSNLSFINRPWKPREMFEKVKRNFKVSGSAHPPYFERHKSGFKGIDYELVNLMIPKWPVAFKIFPENYEPSHGVHYETRIEFLNSENDGDMSVGGLWLTDDFPSTHPYAEQCNTFLVHRPSLLPDSTFVFQYFRAPLWISYFGILITMSLLLKFSYSLYNVSYSFEYCLLLILHYVASLGIVNFPEQNQFYARYMLSVWMLFCLLVTTYFCVGLTVTLRFPRFTRAINYWHDMVDLEINWVENSKFYKNLLTIYDVHDEYLDNLAGLFQYEEDVHVMNEKLSKNCAVRVHKLPGFYLTNTGWMDEYAKKNFKLLKDCFLVWFNSFLFKNPTPFLEYFNKKTLEIVEYGFVKYWYQRHTNTRNNRYMMMFFNEYSDEVIQFIKLDKLKSCFFLLSCGLILGGVVFLLETIIFTLRNRQVSQDKTSASSERN